jgi:hypothetical protein
MYVYFDLVGPEATIMESPVYAAGAEVAVMSCVVQGSPLSAAFWRDLDGRQIKANWKYLVSQVIVYITRILYFI